VAPSLAIFLVPPLKTARNNLATVFKKLQIPMAMGIFLWYNDRDKKREYNETKNDSFDGGPRRGQGHLCAEAYGTWKI